MPRIGNPLWEGRFTIEHDTIDLSTFKNELSPEEAFGINKK